MVKSEKLLQKFLKNPENLRLPEILKICNNFGYEERNGKGSHMVLENNKGELIVIPVHNNDCKRFYKKYVKNKLLGE